MKFNKIENRYNIEVLEEGGRKLSLNGGSFGIVGKGFQAGKTVQVKS
jgi:hypothetical protein